MTVNFNSGSTTGQTGTMGRRTQLLEKWHKQDEFWLGGSSSLHDYCVSQGFNTKQVLGSIEKDLGYTSGSLSWGRSVSSNDDSSAVLFQDANGSFAEVNFDNNKFEIKSERQITSTFTDWSNGRPYDAYKLDQGGFTFYQLFNTGSGDGAQDRIYINKVKNDLFKWGLSTFVQIENGTQA